MAVSIYDLPKDTLQHAIQTSKSIGGTLKKLEGVSNNSYNGKKLRQLIDKYSFDTSHFDLVKPHQITEARKQGYKKLSQTLKKQYASGERVPAQGVGRGHGGYVEGIWYRSSYEIVVARYLHKAGIAFDYESIIVPGISETGEPTTKLSDFLIDGEIYEVWGWQDKSNVVDAFESSGYTIHLIGQQEIALLMEFLSPEECCPDDAQLYNGHRYICQCGKSKKPYAKYCSDCKKDYNQNHPKVCANCQASFISIVWRTKYCDVCAPILLTEQTIIFSSESFEKLLPSLQDKLLTCEICQTRFATRRRNARYCSFACNARSTRRTERPTAETLAQEIWEMPTIAIAQKYSVSDNAVAKWCKAYNIEKPPRGYWQKRKGQERADQPPVSRKEMKRLVEIEKMSVKDLTKHFNAAQMKVAHWLALYELRTETHIELGIYPQFQNNKS